MYTSFITAHSPTLIRHGAALGKTPIDVLAEYLKLPPDEIKRMSLHKLRAFFLGKNRQETLVNWQSIGAIANHQETKDGPVFPYILMGYILRGGEILRLKEKKSETIQDVLAYNALRRVINQYCQTGIPIGRKNP